MGWSTLFAGAERTAGQVDGRVDWISFTLETPREPTSHNDLYLLSSALIKQIGKGHHDYLWDGQGFEPVGTRTPYRICLGRDDHGVRAYGSSPTKTVLYELAGRACEGLYSWNDQRGFLEPVVNRMSRLDYAVDIRTDTAPATFSNARSSKTFRTISYIRSDTGETVYIGSPKSDRFCRVYRYNKPHPRAELLRVEFVFRRELARSAAGQLCQSQTKEEFISALGNTWGLAHKDWQPSVATAEKIKVPVITQQQEDTVMWLYKQVAPALRRMIEAGAIDITDWLSFVYDPQSQLPEQYNQPASALTL